MNSLTMSKRTMLVALLAAFGLALMLAASMASPAYAASKKPYAGVQVPSSYSVYDTTADHNYKGTIDYVKTDGAGEITMTNVGDTRKVKAGLLDSDDSFTIWTGNDYYERLSSINGNLYDAAGDYTNDFYTYVKNTTRVQKFKGVTYNKAKNTLTLKNVNAPQYVLNVQGMGTGFKIVLKGKKNRLAGINVQATEKLSVITKTDDEGKVSSDTTETGFYPSCVTIGGTGKLVINKKKYVGGNNTKGYYNPIVINGGGLYYQWNATLKDTEAKYAYTKSTLKVTKKPKVQIYAYGTADLAYARNSSAKKPVSFAGLKKGTLSAAVEKISSAKVYKSDSFSAVKTDATGWLYGNAAGTVKYARDYSWNGTSGFSCISLNNGTMFGVPDTDAGFYYDTKTQQTYYSSWRIYTKVPVYEYTSTQKGYDDEGYPIYEGSYQLSDSNYAVYTTTVGNSKNLPKGYTGDSPVTKATHYEYVVKNSKLTAGKI